MTTGRVHRKLSPNSDDPLFRLDLVGGDTWDDAALTGISISRGGEGSSGPPPSTMTTTLVAELPPAGDLSARVSLTDHGASIIAGLTGKPAASIRDRWAGRVGAQTVTDKGPADKYGNRTTTIEAAHWLAQLNLIDHLPVIATTGMYVNEAVARMLQAARLPLAPYTATGKPAASPQWDTIAVSTEQSGSSFRDLLTTYTTDAGTHWRTRRSGAIDLRHITARAAAFNNWQATAPLPLHRSHCLTPVSWRQPATSPATVTYTYRKSDNTTVTAGWTVYSANADRPIRSEPLDFTKLHDRTGFAPIVSLARANESAGLGYRIEQITVDLVHLLTSANAGDRQQAGQLLALEYDDPIVLSYDWPVWVRGCYIVDQIQETISQNAWTMTLDLRPVRAVVGGTGPATIAGTTWDTYALGAWNSVTKTWEAP